MITKMLRRIIPLLIFSLVLPSIMVEPVHAAAIIVNTASDASTAGDGLCSLREAIINANDDNETTSGDCISGSGADTIAFSEDFTIALSGSQLPEITTAITITGNGAENTILNGGSKSRILLIASIGNLTLTGVTLTGGKCDFDTECTGSSVPYYGGGIYNNGNLTLEGCSIINNYASGIAGGLYNSGTATIKDSTIADNSGPQDGGGIYNTGADSSLTISGSKINGNRARYQGAGISNSLGKVVIDQTTISGNYMPDGYYYGGGISNLGGSVQISGSTISGNSANDGAGIYNSYYYDYEAIPPEIGGITIIQNSTISGNNGLRYAGIYNDQASTISLVNTTVSNNTASLNVGGIYNEVGYDYGEGWSRDSGTLNLSNTIVANNSGADCFNAANDWDGDGVIEPEYYHEDEYSYEQAGNLGWNINNLIETNATGVNACATPALSIDPGLDNTLKENDGTTYTHALLAGSGAIDAGDSETCLAVDQRGYFRPVGSGCDIGAFEYGHNFETPVVDLAASIPTNNSNLSASPESLKIAFNKDVVHDGGETAADNTVNYLLVERGINGAFDTQSCFAGITQDDTVISIDTAIYDPESFTTTLTVNGNIPLPAGYYRLFVCGTTSIQDAYGNKLNDGEIDGLLDFNIELSAVGKPILPATGFAKDGITLLPDQPAEKIFTTYPDMVLNIPLLNVSAPIVGVPSTSTGWDVSWLGRNAGYLQNSAFPTWTGNSVITGHVWDADNQPGIFIDLKKLKTGDRIEVTGFGQKSIYMVTQSSVIWPSQVDTVMTSIPDTSVITLLTCEDYDLATRKYGLRRMVRAVLVYVE